MSYQAIDMGTSVRNDGEKLFSYFTKADAMFAELYSGTGTATHAITDVASAATCDIGAATTDRVCITGDVTITSFGTSANKLRFVHFDAALTLTYNATSLILPDAVNKAVEAGDAAIFSSDASGNWRCLSYYSSDDDVDSSDVNFTQSGTGAVERTALAKMRDVVSVLDFIPVALHAGIVAGTNTTDLVSYVNAVITAVNAAGGGWIYFPAGTYLVGASSGSVATALLSNVHLIGAGVGATVIKLKDAADAHVFNMEGKSNVTISRMTIDGNRANQTLAVHGVRLGMAGGTNQNVRLSQLEIFGTFHYGIGIQNATNKDIYIEDIEIHDVGADGIDIKNVDDANENIFISRVSVRQWDLAGGGNQSGIDCRGPCHLSHIWVSNPAQNATFGLRFREGEALDANGIGAHRSSLSQFYIDMGSATSGVGIYCPARDVAISNGYVRGGQDGVTLSDSGIKLANITVESVSDDGFYFQAAGSNLDADDCAAVNCEARSCGDNGFRVDSDRVQLIGCRGTLNDDGVLIAAGADATQIIGGKFSGNTTNQIADLGTNTSIRNVDGVSVIGSETATGFGFGTNSPDRRLHSEVDDASNSAVTYVGRVTHTTSGSPSAGIGVGLEFEVETAAANNEIGATIEAVTTDVTSTSEDFDLVIKTMAAGAAAAKRARFPSTGGIALPDTNASHDLVIKPGSDLAAERTLTLTTGDADRTLDISAGSVTISAAAATVLDDASVRAMCATLGTWYMLAHSAVALTTPADTNKNALATVVVPAGAMGANGILRITTHWTTTNGADDKITSYELGGTAFFSAINTAIAGLREQRTIANRNNQSSQVCVRASSVVGFGSLSNSTTTGAIDTSSAQNLIFYGQKETGGDSLVLESYTVELLYQA